MPWGEARFIDGAGELPTTFRYTGQREEAGIGLYFYEARWYDAALGRFVQADSIIPDSRNSKDLDRFAYVRNNPVQYKDPSGHDPWDFIGQFSEGFVKEMALRNGGWLAPSASQEVLSVNSAETSASLIGRIAGDVATIVLGVENVTTGVGLATGGTAVACGTTLCLGAAATITGGVAVAAVGATQVTQGSLGLGGNLAQLSGKGGDTGIFQQKGIPTTNHFYDTLEDWGISEKDAFNAYQNGKKYTDAKGQWIRWNPKTKVAVVIDPTDGEVITVIGDVNKASSEWEPGWFDEFDQYDELFP